MKEIEIIISPDGQVKVEAKGFRGRECATATADFLKELGGKQCETKKSEWYQKERLATRQTVRNGG